MVQNSEVSWVNVADELGVEVFPEAMPSFGRDVRYPASDSDVKFVTDRYEEGLPIEGPLTLGALAYIGMRAESEIETASFAVVVDVERDRQRRQKAGRRARPSEVRKEGRKGKNG